MDAITSLWQNPINLFIIAMVLFSLLWLMGVYILWRKTVAEAEALKRQAEAETLRQAAAIVNSSLSLEVVLTRILEQLYIAIPYDSATVQQKEGDNLIIRAAKGFPDNEALIDLDFAVTADLPNSLALRTRKPLALANVRESFPYFDELANDYQANDIVSWLGVPLVLDETILGMITIDRNTVRPFSSDEITMAVTFADHASIALRNANIYQELESYSERLEEAVNQRTLELQHTTEQVETILHNSPDAILLLDAHHRIERVNPAFETLFGYSAATVQATSPFTLAAPEYRREFMEACATAVACGTPQRLEFAAQRQDKRAIDVSVALAPICGNDEIKAIVCSLHDISAFKEVERLKDDFVSNVSHELRTPITNLKLHFDLIRLNPVKQAVYMEQIGREIERLHITIESLLRLSRLDQRRMEINPTWIDLAELARQYVQDRTSQAEAHGLSLRLEIKHPTTPVKADGRLLEQALSILLTNAINYTPPGGEITLRNTCRRADGRLWIGLSVQDTGPGVSPEESDLIFNRFFRGKIGRSSGVAGTGLGLAIAKEIVNLHQGDLSLEVNETGPGSLFTIWLPGPKELDIIGNKLGTHFEQFTVGNG